MNKLPDDFNWQEYTRLNIDLKDFSENEAINHFINHGLNENRLYKIDYNKIPSDFDWKIYVELNKDLNFLTSESLAINHFINHGLNENRLYKIDYNKIPSDFDWKIYVELNKDLNFLTSESLAINHFINHGINENRLYKIDYNKIPSDFDWKIYVELNKDLNFLTSESLAINHYLRHGIDEERIYRKFTNINYIENTNTNKNDNNILNVDVYDDFNDFDYINDDEIIYTRLFLNENPLYLKYNIDLGLIDSMGSFIFVIDFNNGGGGTTIFLNTIVSKYKKYNNFLILRFDGTNYYLNINEEYLIKTKFDNIFSIINLIEFYKNNIQKIFINHFMGFDETFINYILNLNIVKIGITHDYYNIFLNPQPKFKSISVSNLNSKIDVNKFDKMITQHKTNLNIFSRYYNKNFDVVKLPDFLYQEEQIFTENKYINCCVIGNIIDIKGLNKLIEFTKFIKEKTLFVKICIIGYVEPEYKNYFESCEYYNGIHHFNNLLKKHKPNLLIELSEWPETYSYTLTLSMLTDLPILYLSKPIDAVVENRLKQYKKSYKFYNFVELLNLIYKHTQNFFYTIKPVLYYNKYWNDLFIEDISKKIIINKKSFKYNIKPYFIYFPQFHEIQENNINFYEKYNDVQNLKLFNQSNSLFKLPEPSIDYCDINSYDYVLNNNLIQKQIDLINYYGFSGLAIYYYWFSINTITNKNMIMENVIDKFFDSLTEMYDLKVFFIWANENWTDNSNFLLNEKNEEKSIKNIYNHSNYKKNSRNLIKYFKNKNYLKIDNKPVLFIYHSDLVLDVNEFFYVLEKVCKNNGFNGVHLVLNSFEKEYEQYKNFYINFNYKKYDCRFFDEKNKQIKLDYNQYMNDGYHFKKNKIQTIAYDFDNTPRLFKPDNLSKSTICINNSQVNKIVFTKKIIENYKDDKDENELNKILLINALNEWGENMVFEPSNKYGYYNINLLHNLLES